MTDGQEQERAETGDQAFGERPPAPEHQAGTEQDERSTPPANDVEPAGTAEVKPERSRVREVFGAIGTGLMTGLLIAILGIAALAIVVPAATGSTALTVMTSSMEPGLPPGTMVVVRPTDVSEIVPGDVITYQLSSGEPTLVTHRVTQRLLTADGEPLFITKGDNNPAEDLSPVQPVQVRGTVWYSIPYIGWLTNVITGDIRGLIIPVAAIGLFGYAVWMLISWIRDRARKARASD